MRVALSLNVLFESKQNDDAHNTYFTTGSYTQRKKNQDSRSYLNINKNYYEERNISPFFIILKYWLRKSLLKKQHFAHPKKHSQKWRNNLVTFKKYITVPYSKQKLAL